MPVPDILRVQGQAAHQRACLWLRREGPCHPEGHHVLGGMSGIYQGTRAGGGDAENDAYAKGHPRPRPA